MGNTIGFEGTIQGVQKMMNGPQLEIRTFIRTGKVNTQTFLIVSPDVIINASELWSGAKAKGGDYVGRANTLLKGKKVVFYIKD